MPTANRGYNTPAAGTSGWDVPLNENWDLIETDVTDLIARLSSVSEADVGGYNRPEKGATNWNIPVNENFGFIEADLQTIAAAIEQEDGPLLQVPALDQPQEGEVGWHVPVNGNFEAIDGFVADAFAALDQLGSGSGTETIWRMQFNTPPGEISKPYSERDRDVLQHQLFDQGWEYVNWHVGRGLDFSSQHAIEGSHSMAFFFMEDERMGAGLRKRIGLTEAWAQYWIKFENGFDVTDDDFASWADGGKMPGWHITTDIDQTDPGKAWITFHDPDRVGETPHDQSGKIHLNYYVENANETEADTKAWDSTIGTIDSGTWYELTLYANTETGGLKAWVDGQKAYDANHDWNGRTLKWAHVSHFGGGWYSPQDQHLYTDDLRVYKSNPL